MEPPKVAPMDVESQQEDQPERKPAVRRIKFKRWWTKSECGFWTCFGFDKNPTFWKWTWAIIAIISLLLLIILLPLSYSYVEYYQYALNKNTITNKVDMSKVHENGRYFWGVSHEPVTFPRHFQLMELTVPVFPSNGMEFDVDIDFYYRLDKDNITNLYQAFGQTFDNQVEIRAKAKIKNSAPEFSLEQYITDRTALTQHLHDDLQDELDRVWIKVPFDKFYFGEITIPESIRQRDLDAAIQRQRNIEEENRQKATVVRKETKRLENEVFANITKIESYAKSYGDSTVVFR